MCLAVPGMVIEVIEAEPPFTTAVVEFGGIRRRVSLACVPEARHGDYVLVHAGVAISRLDAFEAARVLEALEQLDLGEEFPEQEETNTTSMDADKADNS
jgi:hydrogenase expression/formation protein HypC